MSESILPQRLLSAPPEDIVFYRNMAPVTYATFRADIAAARQALARLDVPEFVLYDSDAYSFFVWLLACWLNGQTALLAADDLPATRAFHSLPWVGSCEGSALNDWSGFAAAAKEFSGAAPPFGRAGMVFFTSGSSGTPSRIYKVPQQLYREAPMLQQLFGDVLPSGTRFVGTVPHQHMFGLPFRLIWPLCLGYPIVSEHFHHPEELGKLQAGPHVLLSSPAVLKRLAQLETFSSPANFLVAFSAGSPLHDSVAAACASRLGARMVEMYGSSETGSVMYRFAPGNAWRELPGVTVALDENGCLKLRSPFLDGNPDANDWFQTQDTAHREADGWHLTGRADRVAKIEGRRVALDALETALQALPEVAEARTIPLYGERDEIVAAVVLSDVGRAHLQAFGKTRFDRRLRQALSASLERIALPRRWCYVSALPYNTMGKVTAANIARLFERQAVPPFVVTKRAPQEMVLTLALRTCAQAFDGHFPQMPVLPGVLQVDWALRLAQRYFSIEGHFSGLRQLKFQRLLRPEDEVSLTLRFFPEKKEVSFVYASALGEHSRGRAFFERSLGEQEARQETAAP
ncbi:MAG: AMP-binding protein [Burkholderiales bacterium]|jgi:hypothetical protein|nr:AMP-binding protein [Burkholderiales bacterium]